MDITLDGMDELQSQLAALSRFGDRDAVRATRPGADVLRDGVRDKIREQGLIDSGDMLNSVSLEIIDRGWIVQEGPLPYVLAQEFGLQDQPITERQRSFFWAMYSETNDDMWRALALSTTYTIPARPHFRPGVRESQRDAAQAIGREATRIILSRI